MKFRIWLAKQCYRLSVWLYQPPEPVKPYVSIDTELPLKPTPNIVDADKHPLQWSEHQSGNVIVAEPLLVAKHRRGEL